MIDDIDPTKANPAESHAAGLSYVPEERMKDGAVGEFDITEILLLTREALGLAMASG